MNALRQIIAVTALSLRSIHTRLKASLMVVTGLAIVVMVMQFFLSAGEGIRHGYLDGADAGRAIVTALGAQTAWHSSLSRNAANMVMDAPGIARAPDGAPAADAELATSVHLAKKNGADGYTILLGFAPPGFALRPELKLVAGRFPTPGRRELIVGIAAHEKFAGADIGGQLRLPDGLWPVVGIFSAPNMMEGNLIGDTGTLMAALRRTEYSFVTLRLDSFAAFHDALAANPALEINVERETDYWQRLFDDLPTNIIAFTVILGSLTGLGAFAGTLQTMYSAVTARENEIAVLRALGFGGFAVAASVVLEAMLLAMVGSAIGTAVIWHWWNGFAYNGAYGVLRIRLTPSVYLITTSAVLAIAFIGALSPAIKASRVTVVDALRAY